VGILCPASERWPARDGAAGCTPRPDLGRAAASGPHE
jgi:hypothetical protein